MDRAVGATYGQIAHHNGACGSVDRAVGATYGQIAHHNGACGSVDRALGLSFVLFSDTLSQ